MKEKNRRKRGIANNTSIEIKNSVEGITLIALVITIIVLLILAGVSIATLTGKNGILTQANDVKIDTKIGEEKEKIKLSALGALTKNNGGKILESNLADELTNYIGIRNVNYQLTGVGPFVVKYLDSGRSYQIDENGNVNEYVNIAEYIKIGDYVNYTPDNIEESYEKFGDSYAGYSYGDHDMNANLKQDDNLKWRVLNINTDGTIDLISDKPTSDYMYFIGQIGYNNGVYLLNDYCKTMYSNSSINAIGRSLNIEDIENKIKIDETTGKKVYEKYTSATGTVYGNKYIYSNKKWWYPLQWKNDNGIIGESDQKEVKEYATQDDAEITENTELSVTQTYYELSSDETKSNFLPADTRDLLKSSSIYYELLCNNGESYYWLASRCVKTDSTQYDAFIAGFGLRMIVKGKVTGCALCTSTSQISKWSQCVRPVVSLKHELIDISMGYDETKGGWNLK